MDYNQTLIDQALGWLQIGIGVIPCQPKSKIAAVPWKNYQTKLPTQYEVDNWFSSGNPNLAIVTGWRGLVVIDFDSLEWYQTWRGLYHIDTYAVATGRGVHVYLFCDENIKSGTLPGIGDLKAAGGYVLASPSVHPSGAVYRVLNYSRILRVSNLGDVFPEGLLNHQTRPAALQVPLKPKTVIDDPWEAALTSPADLVGSIKEKIGILGFFQDAVKTGPGWYIARCPFHDDHNPSFWIDANRGLCGCYSGCNSNKPMDIINFYSRLRGLSNSDAIAELGRVIRS